MQLHLRIELVTYEGWCRDNDGLSSDALDQSDEGTFEKCKEKCYENQKCTAFSYETTPSSKYYNCYSYQGGPYTTGSGRPNTKCYIVEQGKFFQFYIYTYDYN